MAIRTLLTRWLHRGLACFFCPAASVSLSVSFLGLPTPACFCLPAFPSSSWLSFPVLLTQHPWVSVSFCPLNDSFPSSSYTFTELCACFSVLTSVTGYNCVHSHWADLLVFLPFLDKDKNDFKVLFWFLKKVTLFLVILQVLSGEMEALH